METFYVTQLAGRTRISPLCFFFFFQNVLFGLYKRCICEVDVNVFILALHLVHPSDFCSELEPRHVCPIKESSEGGALLVQMLFRAFFFLFLREMNQTALSNLLSATSNSAALLFNTTQSAKKNKTPE